MPSEKSRAMAREWVFEHDMNHTPTLAALLDKVREERDFEWWEQTILVDIVPPTPEGGKHWQAILGQHIQEQRDSEWVAAVEKVRDRIDSDAARVICDEILREMGIGRRDCKNPVCSMVVEGKDDYCSSGCRTAAEPLTPEQIQRERAEVERKIKEGIL